MRLLPGLRGTGAWAGLASVGSWSQPSGDTKGQGASACGAGRAELGRGFQAEAARRPRSVPSAPLQTPGPLMLLLVLAPSPVAAGARTTPTHGPSPAACAVRPSRFPYFVFFLQ